MVDNPHLLVGFIMAMVYCTIGAYWQGLIMFLAVIYATDDTTFYTIQFVGLVFLVVAFARREAGGDKRR